MARPRVHLVSRLGVLAERDFRLYFLGQSASWIGTGMVPVALSFAVLSRGGTATDVGYVLGAETVPLVCFLLIGGVIADRFSRRSVMVGADLLRCSAQGVLAILVLADHAPLFVFMILESFVGAGTAFFSPAMTGLIPEISSSARLQQANALNGMATWVGSLIGPAVGGVLVATVGAGWAIAADALTYLLSAVCLAQLPAGRAARRSESFAKELRAGWQDFRSRTWLWVVVGQFSFFHLLVFAPFLVLGAVISRDSYGGAGAWGAILAAEGVGSILAGILLLRFRPRRPLVTAEIAVLSWTLPLIALGLRAPLVLVVIAAALAGAGIGIFGPLWDTTMQREIPAPLLSRVSAYDWFGSVVLFPVGFAIAGPVSSAIGADAALFFGAGFLAMSTVVVLAVPGVTKLELERRDSSSATAK